MPAPTPGPIAPEGEPPAEMSSTRDISRNQKSTREQLAAAVVVPTKAVYSPAEAAEFLGVTRQTIYVLIADGKLRRFKIGRLTRIPATDLHALVGLD